MRLSKTALQMLAEIANGNRGISSIAEAVRKSKAQIYRTARKLTANGFITSSYEPAKTAHVSLLLQLLSAYPSTINPLSGSGIKLLTSLLKPKCVAEITQETGIKRAYVFRKLRQAKAISLARLENGKYLLNYKIWGKAIDFIKELKKHEETTDARVPSGSVIYFKNEKEIVFSSKEELDAVPTGFSAYEKYGIKLLTVTNDYYLPKKKLSMEEVFRHSLYITEKDFEIWHIIFIALFYAKYKKSLFRIKHKILENLDNIFKGQRIQGYPSLEEIRDRAEVYGIKI